VRADGMAGPVELFDSPPARTAARAQAWSRYEPIWIYPLVRALVLDEHGPMPRTVQAQVGFGALLIGVQFCLDMLAWTMGLRWVFVNAMGWGGWALVFLFAGLFAGIIAIFERYVLTAALGQSRLPVVLRPAILVRIAVVVLFAFVTSVPVEMLIFNDVVQGQINGQVQGNREAARAALRGDIQKELDALQDEEGKARKRVKEETPPLNLEDVTTTRFDGEEKRVREAIAQVLIDQREEKVGIRSGRIGEGRLWHRLRIQREQLEKSLADLVKSKDEELEKKRSANRKMQAEAADRHFKALQEVSVRFDARRQLMIKRLNAVDDLADDELARVTRRTFRVPDGFARRWQILQEAEDATPLFGWTKWAIRAIFISFGLLVLTTKALFNPTTRAYYDRGLDAEDSLPVARG
jgi:hypothetical protein